MQMSRLLAQSALTRGLKCQPQDSIRTEGLADSQNAISSSMAHRKDEQCQDRSARERTDDDSSFELPVGLELEGKRHILELLELTSTDELRESSSPDALEVPGARVTKRFIDRRVPCSERVRERAPNMNGSCHQKERTNQPDRSDDAKSGLEFHVMSSHRGAAER